MIELKRILVPIDFSDYSHNALIYGCSLSERFGSEVVLLHVLQDYVAMVPEPGLAFPAPGDFMKTLESNAIEAMKKLPDSNWPLGGTVTRIVRHGPPFVEIVRYSRENAIDLIVMGTHGRTGLAHMLMGSVAEKVVRKAPCPVLTVRPDQHQFAMP